MRTFQYLPYFKAAGIAVDVRPLLGNSYLNNYYAGRRNLVAAAKGYISRFFYCNSLGGYDAILVEKESFPWLPYLFEVVPRNLKLILDFDDAIFHNYDTGKNVLIRSLLADKIDRLMAHADLVIVGNAYLGNRALVAGARRVELVPTVVNLERYTEPTPRSATGRRLRVGWIGSPATEHYLAGMIDAVTALRAKHDVDFVAIGARSEAAEAAGFTAVKWTEETEVSNLRTLDIGVMPLIDGPWERGKCGYKLIQYMACGVPVVASPVGVNTDIVREGENGFCASSTAEWISTMDRLLSDADLRYRLGKEGRSDVERTFCLQVQGPRLVQLLKSVVAR